MALSSIQVFPDGSASAPGLALDSEPGTGLFKKGGGQIGLSVAGVEVGSFDSTGMLGNVYMASMTFQAAGAHVFTGTIPLPASSRIIDIGVDGIALWTAATSASIIVGDDVDPDGFFTATDLKATDLLAGEINNLEHPGGKAGAYIVSEQRNLYQSTARNVVAVVTQVGASNTGTTRVYVVYGVAKAYTPVTTS